MERKRQIDGVYSVRPAPVSTEKVLPVRPAKPASKQRARGKKSVVVLVLILAVAGLILGVHKITGGNTSLVPKNIQKSVNFSIYYPDTKKIPAGYNLDIQSFRLAQPGVVLFAVTYAGGKSIIFSEQQQPSNNDMDKFISSYIPVNTTQQLALGQAKIGAYGSVPNVRTVASLPIHGTWLIVTAPADVSQDDLVNILQALTK